MISQSAPPSTKLIRFLVIYNGPLNPNGGSSGTVWQSTAALQRLGHHVDVITESDIHRSVSHPNLHYAFELPRRILSAAKVRLHHQSYEAILISQPYGYLVGKWLRNISRPPLYLHRSHGHELVVADRLPPLENTSFTQSKPGWKQIATRVLALRLQQQARLALKYADGTIVPSSFDRDFLIDREGVDPKKVRFIPHASVPAYLETPAKPYTPERHKKLLYVGTFSRQKGGETIWEACSAILRKYPDLTLTIVSPQKDHHQVTAGFHQDVSERISLVDWVGQDALMDIYDQHGIQIVPSRYEGAGKAHYESMSRGLSLVCSEIGAMMDSIVSGENGLLVKAGDSAGFVTALSSLVEQYDIARRLAENSRRTSLEYSWDRNAKEIVAYVNDLLAEKAQAAKNRNPKSAPLSNII